MIRHKINFAPEAAKEIEDIYLYIADDSPNNAAKWYFAVHNKIRALKDFPDSCPIAYEDRSYDFQILISRYEILFSKITVSFIVYRKTLSRFCMSSIPLSNETHFNCHSVTIGHIRRHTEFETRLEAAFRRNLFTA